jgi:hypothetical protein
MVNGRSSGRTPQADNSLARGLTVASASAPRGTTEECAKVANRKDPRVSPESASATLTMWRRWLPTQRLVQLGYQDTLSMQEYERQGIAWEYRVGGYSGDMKVVPRGILDWDLHLY